MTGDFNSRYSDWDPLYPHHLTHSNTLREIADTLNLDLSTPINSVLTWYVDNLQDLNLVIDLMFFQAESEEFNNHQILPNLQSPSNHTPLLVSIIIKEEFIQERKQTIVKNSKDKK